jgi:hypothetical protein
MTWRRQGPGSAGHWKNREQVPSAAPASMLRKPATLHGTPMMSDW